MKQLGVSNITPFKQNDTYRVPPPPQACVAGGVVYMRAKSGLHAYTCSCDKNGEEVSIVHCRQNLPCITNKTVVDAVA